LTSPKTIRKYYRVGNDPCDPDKDDKCDAKNPDNLEKRSNIFQVILTRCGTEEISLKDSEKAPKEYELG